jgi:16S rRNA (adenine1518-N6/adenine1519-N6)-dimethyltransferase
VKPGTRPIEGHRPRRRFGQNFLEDREVVQAIVRAIDPQPDDLFVEIGPGLGVLTAPLLDKLRHLHAVEIDRDLAARLRSRFPEERLTLHNIDVLDFDFSSLGASFRAAGNLPYNISTELLFRLETAAGLLRDAHFMLQREVVDRMVAAPSTAAYGRLSVMLQSRFDMERLIDVPPEAFRPPPKVNSAVVRLIPLPVPVVAVAERPVFARIVTAAFTQRRKTLRNALADFIDAAALETLGIDPQLRPENLSVADYAKLTRHPQQNR